MLKEIKYGGFTANPNDHDSVEGDLAVAMNLVPEDGTVKPVLPPSDVFTVPSGSTIMCIHKTAAYTHYILWNEATHTLSYMDKQGETYTATTITLGITLSGVAKVEPIGNTLVVLADDGIHYILWKPDGYNYLGSHLPELDIQFSAFGVQPRIRTQLTHGVYEFELSDEEEDRQYQKVVRDRETRSGICNAAMAALNATFRGIAGKKLFMFPFFVRYAFRLYDGNLTMHSAPILIALPSDVPPVNMIWNVEEGVIKPMQDGSGRDRYYGCSVDPIGYVLCKRAVDSAQLQELESWSDIISKVSIFISQQFYTYEMDAKNDDIIIGMETTKVPAAKNLIAQMSNNANFYLAAEYDIDKINDTSNDKPWSRSARDTYYSARILGKIDGYSQINIDFEPTNDNIVTRQAMTDDYQTHDRLLPTTETSSFAYNNRINLANMNRLLFKGFAPCCLWFDFDEAFSNGTTSPGRHGWATDRTPNQSAEPDYSAQAKLCEITVIVKTSDGREVAMASEQRYMYFYEDEKILWFFYPDENAIRAYFRIGENKYEINLKKHSMLNGSYYFSLEEDVSQTQVQSIPSPSAEGQCIVSMPNKVYTSEVNNPFYFPLLGINSISSGSILGICAAVRPVSTSQMGYADLYIFADSGVWVAKINEKGTYSNISLATGDICINPDSITQMETTVLFATARGIMLISGSQTQCISDAINDGDVPPENGMQTVMDAFAQLGRSYPTIAPFRDFLGDEDASLRMLYDYRHQRIIVYNPTYSYAYIYSLESHKWGMMESDIQYTINSYPDALAVTGDNVLVDYSDSPVGDGSAIVIPALLVTRPLTFDLPDVHKTVRRVLQRGMFRRWQGGEHMTALLYGSRDLYDWRLIYASNGERMQGFSGTPYKWFRVALVLNIDGNESITGATIELIDKYTGKPR